MADEGTQAEDEDTEHGGQLPPPLPLSELVLRVTGMTACAVPTKTSVLQAKDDAEAWQRLDARDTEGIGLMDTSLKNITARCFGKHGFLNYFVVLPPDGSLNSTESKLQFEFATGTDAQKKVGVQKEKILKWCADRAAWRDGQLDELAPAGECDLKDYPLTKEQLVQAVVENQVQPRQGPVRPGNHGDDRCGQVQNQEVPRGRGCRHPAARLDLRRARQARRGGGRRPS